MAEDQTPKPNPEEVKSSKPKPEDTAAAEAKLEEAKVSKSKPEEAAVAESKPEEVKSSKPKPKVTAAAKSKSEGAVAAKSKPEKAKVSTSKPEGTAAEKAKPKGTAAAQAAKAKSKEKKQKAEDKPFAEFIQEDYLPALTEAFAAEDIEDITLDFADNQVTGIWLDGKRQFKVYFPEGDIKQQRAFSWATNSGEPSIIEPFLVDERKITLELLVFGVMQRLNAQKWFGNN